MCTANSNSLKVNCCKPTFHSSSVLDAEDPIYTNFLETTYYNSYQSHFDPIIVEEAQIFRYNHTKSNNECIFC